MAHAVAVRIKDAAGQKRGWAPQPAAPRHRLGRKLGLHRRKQRGIENGLVFTTVNGAPVSALSARGKDKIGHLFGANARRWRTLLVRRNPQS
jgi:hypothetical protein